MEVCWHRQGWFAPSNIPTRTTHPKMRLQLPAWLGEDTPSTAACSHCNRASSPHLTQEFAVAKEALYSSTMATSLTQNRHTHDYACYPQSLLLLIYQQGLAWKLTFKWKWVLTELSVKLSNWQLRAVIPSVPNVRQSMQSQEMCTTYCSFYL